MNVLLLTQIVPYPPDSGPKVKTYHVLRFLAERGHRVTLLSFVRPEEERHLKNLEHYCAEIQTVPMRRSRWSDALAYMGSLRTGLPFLVTRDAKPKMRKAVSELVQKTPFDVVHADQLTMAQFALDANGAGRVFDAHNAVWAIVDRARKNAPLFLSPFLAQEARRLKVYEGRLCQQMDAVLAVSAADRQALVEAGADQAKISVIPIAVDSATLRPVKRFNQSSEIITISTLFYPPNADGVRWFIQKVYPLVRKQTAAKLTIVGARPPSDIVKFADRNSASVTVTGYVPDPSPYFERAALTIVPVRAGSGMRVRILEALARGIPVVTTTTGVEGIDATNGEHLLVADEPSEFAGAVVKLLHSPELAQKLSRNGRKLVEEKYDWQVVLPRLENVYTSLSRNK